MLDGVLKWLGGMGISPGLFLGAIVAGLLIGLSITFPSFALVIGSWAFATSPIWLPLALGGALYTMWMHYIQALYLNSLTYSLLEIRVPRDVEKSPRAIELFLVGIYLGIGEGTFIYRQWRGQVRPWFSLELTSFDGEVHMYIWTRTALKDIVETQLYAQFPDIEIYEVEDYASRFRYDPSKFNVWGCDFKKAGKDVYPIKTYVDMNLDSTIEETAVDPIAQVFEFLSGLKSGEQLWIQILIQTDKDKRHKAGHLFKEEDRWKEEAKEEIKNIREAAITKTIDAEGKERVGFPNPTPGDTARIKALETAQGKQPFDVGIRGIYIAEKDKFRGSNIFGLLGVWRPFGYFGSGLSPTRWHTTFNFPWEDYKDFRKERMRSRIIDAYRRRSWFHEPYETPHYVMNTEEIATIFHFPSAAVKSPGLRRTPATKAEPPPNLPL